MQESKKEISVSIQPNPKRPYNPPVLKTEEPWSTITGISNGGGGGPTPLNPLDRP